MKQIQPYKVLLFVLGVLVLLSPIAYFAPSEGWDLGFTKFKFLTSEKILHPVEQENADISNIIANIDTTMVEDEVVEDPLITHQNGSEGNLGAPNGGDVKEDASTELQMNEEGKANLFSLFETLESVASLKKKVSILHYGDSQIEGDRMTSYIRQKLQNQFGGYGPGLIPAVNVYSTFTFKQSYSENFKRYTAFGGDKIKSNKYGSMISVGRFTPEIILDSTISLDTIPEQTGWIEFSPSKSAYSRARDYNNVIMHYNSCIVPTKLVVSQNGAVIHEEMLNTDGAQHTLKLSFPSTPGTLRYTFTGKISPNICAFSLEGDYGVQVSNIAMRGSSGTVFGKVDQTIARAMYSTLNTELIIMQFGGNSVPFFTDSSKVEGYARWFKSQINRLKAQNPNAMVVVIGPSDMSKLEDGIYNTYEFLPYCIEQMKKVTMDTGSAYWNLYAAMGGYNSMPSWVEQGLAGKDYIHFSNGGAKIASQMFYDAFIAEYAKWKANP